MVTRDKGERLQVLFYVRSGTPGVEINGEPIAVDTRPATKKKNLLKQAFGFRKKKLTKRFLALLIHLGAIAKTRGRDDVTEQLETISGVRGWRDDIHGIRTGISEAFEGSAGSNWDGVHYEGNAVHWDVNADIQFETEDACRAWAQKPTSPPDSPGILDGKGGAIEFHPKWSWEIIQDEILATKATDVKIEFRQTWVPGLEVFELDGLSEKLKGKSKRLVGWVYLLGSREQMEFRIKERPCKIDEAVRDLRQTVDFLKNRFHAKHPRRKLDKPVDLCIGFYRFMPFGPILKVDDRVMFIGFYPADRSSDNAPMLIFRKESEDLAGGWEEYWRLFDDQLVVTHKTCTLDLPSWIQ